MQLQACRHEQALFAQFYDICPLLEDPFEDSEPDPIMFIKLKYKKKKDLICWMMDVPSHYHIKCRYQLQSD